MPKNKIIKFRVSTDQFERILNNKNNKGYVTIASFLRDLALQDYLAIEYKILENNKMLKELLIKKGL